MCFGEYLSGPLSTSIGREPTDEELRDVGIDPDENASGEHPDVLE